jgi:tetratricopeptide (TPR) repeat protein
MILGLVSFSTQGISNYYVILAENEEQNETALKHLENAGYYNSENASADLASGFREFQYKRYSEAVPYLRKAIDKGLGVTIIYYYLARSQTLSGNPKAAEKTLAEALRIFPHSIYARTHYAVLLKENGKDVEAEKQFDLARQISPKDARSWRIMFEESILQTTLEAQKNDNLIKPHDLSPHNIVYAMFIAEKMNEADNKPRVSKK